MSVLHRLENYLNQETFKLLVKSEDLEMFQHSNFDWITESSNAQIIIQKNITTDEKIYHFYMSGSPIKLNDLNEREIAFLGTNHSYVCGFSKSDHTSPIHEGLGFKSHLIENSDDNSNIVRETIKSLLNKFYSYDEEFLTKCFDIFDGYNATFVDDLFIHHPTKSCGFTCFEEQVNEVDENTVDDIRHTDLCKKFLSLYGLLTEETESFVDNFRGIFGDENLLISWTLPQKSKKNSNFFKVNFRSKVSPGKMNNNLENTGEIRMNSIKNILQTLVSLKILDYGRFLELIQWVENGNEFPQFALIFEKSGKKVNINPILEIGLAAMDSEFQESIWTEKVEKINYDSPN